MIGAKTYASEHGEQLWASTIRQDILTTDGDQH